MSHHHEPLYRFIARDALTIVWRNKFLWFLGFFVALLGNGGVYEIVFRALDRAVLKVAFGGGRIPSFFTVFAQLKTRALAAPGTLPIIEFILVVLSLIILCIFYFLISSYGMAGLIVAVNKLFQKKKATLRESFAEGQRAMITLSGINILAKVLVSLAVAASALPLGWLFLRSQPAFGIFYVFTFALLVSFGLAVSFLGIYAAASVVLERTHFLRSLQRALHIFRHHVAVSIEMALLLFLINLAASFIVLAFLVSFAGIIGFILTILAAGKLGVLFWIVAFSSLTVAVAAVVLFGSFLGAFQLASWTILFVKIGKGGVVSKLIRLASRFPRLVRHD